MRSYCVCTYTVLFGIEQSTHDHAIVVQSDTSKQYEVSSTTGARKLCHQDTLMSLLALWYCLPPGSKPGYETEWYFPRLVIISRPGSLNY